MPDIFDNFTDETGTRLIELPESLKCFSAFSRESSTVEGSSQCV